MKIFTRLIEGRLTIPEKDEEKLSSSENQDQHPYENGQDRESNDRRFVLLESRLRGDHRFALPLVILLLATAIGFASVASAPEKMDWVVPRAEFNPVHILESRRGGESVARYAPVLFMEKVSATKYLCVAESSVYYPYLTSFQELTGITVDSSCSPLDFTDRPGDNLHPALITQPIGPPYLYYAYVIGFQPTSDTAILAEAHGGVFVLVNVDTLQHLGIDVEVPS